MAVDDLSEISIHQGTLFWQPILLGLSTKLIRWIQATSGAAGGLMLGFALLLVLTWFCIS